MREDTGEVQEDLSYMMEAPRDLHELYMKLRAQLSSSKTFHSYYMKMISIVDIGSQLLPPEYTSLSDEVGKYISSEAAFPGKRQMERSGNMYRMGNDNTGLILVNERDIEIGLREALEQQTSRIIPKLKTYDTKILRVLIAARIVEKKRPILEDILINETMDELSDKIMEQQEKRMKHE